MKVFSRALSLPTMALACATSVNAEAWTKLIPPVVAPEVTPSASQRMAADGLFKHEVSPEQYGAAGVDTSTTGTIAAGSSTLTLANATGWAKGQSVRVMGAGPLTALGTPTISVTTCGGAIPRYSCMPGQTSYTYSVRPIAADGSVGAATTAVTVAFGPATITHKDFVRGVITPGTGAVVGYAIYGGSAGTGNLLTVVDGTEFYDRGVKTTVTSDIIPTTTTGGAKAGFLRAKITALSGTTATLSAAATTAVTGAIAGHDDTQAWRDMLFSACSSGCRVTAKGTYPLSDQIDLSVPHVINGYGRSGVYYSTAALAPTLFVWRGVPGKAVLRQGGVYYSRVLSSASLNFAAIDGYSVATYGLEINDMTFCDDRSVFVQGVSNAGVRLTTSTMVNALTLGCEFHNFRIDLRVKANTQADGIKIDGNPNPYDDPKNTRGVTQHRFYNLWVAHMDGHGVHHPKGVLRGAGDAFLFFGPQLFSAQHETGFCFMKEDDDKDVVTGGMQFYGAVCAGGAYMSSNVTNAHSWIAVDAQNVRRADGATARDTVVGPGAPMVTGFTNNGTPLGITRFMGGLASAVHNDDFELVGLSGSRLSTATGNWTFASQGTGATVGHAVSPGGVTLTSGNTASGDFAAIYTPSLEGGNAANVGVRLFDRPGQLWNVSLSTTANVLTRWGLINTASASPTDGVWVEFDTARGRNYYCVIRADGVETAIDTGLQAVSNISRRWWIEASPKWAVVRVGAATYTGDSTTPPDFFVKVCETTNTTTLPTVYLRNMAQIYTHTTAAATVHLRQFTRTRRTHLR
jgi:hypothetical protein